MGIHKYFTDSNDLSHKTRLEVYINDAGDLFIGMHDPSDNMDFAFITLDLNESEELKKEISNCIEDMNMLMNFKSNG
jgi:hypothetical protein